MEVSEKKQVSASDSIFHKLPGICHTHSFTRQVVAELDRKRENFTFTWPLFGAFKSSPPLMVAFFLSLEKKF